MAIIIVLFLVVDYTSSRVQSIVNKQHYTDTVDKRLVQNKGDDLQSGDLERRVENKNFLEKQNNQTDSRPNILLVFVDDLDHEPLGFMGNEIIQTPSYASPVTIPGYVVGPFRADITHIIKKTDENIDNDERKTQRRLFLFAGRDRYLRTQTQLEPIAQAAERHQFLQATVGGEFGGIGLPLEYTFQVLKGLLDPHAAFVVGGGHLWIYAGGQISSPVRIGGRSHRQVHALSGGSLANDDLPVMSGAGGGSA